MWDRILPALVLLVLALVLPVSVVADEDSVDPAPGKAGADHPAGDNLAGKWYFGAGDFNFQFDWTEGGAATIPIALQAGRIIKIGRYNYNFSAEVEWTAIHEGSGVVRNGASASAPCCYCPTRRTLPRGSATPGVLRGL